MLDEGGDKAGGQLRLCTPAIIVMASFALFFFFFFFGGEDQNLFIKNHRKWDTSLVMRLVKPHDDRARGLEQIVLEHVLHNSQHDIQK